MVTYNCFWEANTKKPVRKVVGEPNLCWKPTVESEKANPKGEAYYVGVGNKDLSETWKDIIISDPTAKQLWDGMTNVKETPDEPGINPLYTDHVRKKGENIDCSRSYYHDSVDSEKVCAIYSCSIEVRHIENGKVPK